MMEFIVSTDLETALPAEIGFNFEELKTELAERLNYYNGLVVTEDGIKEAKDDRAKLNKLRSAIDTRRKDIKKQYLAPYNEFEAKVKELTALIDQPIGAIDGQLAAYEEQRKADKRQDIEAAYADIVPENIAHVIPLEKIFDNRWLNATMDMRKVEEAIASIAKRTKTELSVIEMIEPDLVPGVMLKYKETLDFDAAMKYRTTLRAAAEAAEAAKAKKEETPELPPETVAYAAPEQPIERPAPAEKVYALRLEFHLTMNQANALKRFLADNRIDYMKI